MTTRRTELIGFSAKARRQFVSPIVLTLRLCLMSKQVVRKKDEQTG
jgi:hypothetical protein